MDDQETTGIERSLRLGPSFCFPSISADLYDADMLVTPPATLVDVSILIHQQVSQGNGGVI